MSPRTIDFYSVLQVAPEAEREVIDAAYRQLMRKYHPDVAGGDLALAKRLNERAKSINQAYAVLRDDRQRRIYDRMRHTARPRPTASSAPPPPPAPPREPTQSEARPRPPTPQAQEVSEPEEVEYVDAGPSEWSFLAAPVRALSAAYFLLPGPYEWEPGSRREYLMAWLIPPLGIVVWLAATGRLSWLLGRAPFAVLAIYLSVAAILFLTQWRALPRLLVAGGSGVLLVSGLLDVGLRSASLPIWLGWSVLGCVNLTLAARQFVFGVLPAVGVCWLLARMG